MNPDTTSRANNPDAQSFPSADDLGKQEYEVLLDSVSFAVSERVKLLLTLFTTVGLLAIIVELQSHYGM